MHAVLKARRREANKADDSRDRNTALLMNESITLGQVRNSRATGVVRIRVSLSQRSKEIDINPFATKDSHTYSKPVSGNWLNKGLPYESMKMSGYA